MAALDPDSSVLARTYADAGSIFSKLHRLRSVERGDECTIKAREV